ncbi:ribokinase [Gryllotalpicola protaetiae]|uniref:Ribokinase n=1 Tax=Gryllotalpicola protaetiae TaxID=2419771 RepID=A0A387BWL9_9MICO|nr:ribokinase [Gryllotalpicola protaetiae]AYG02711.1 ribokinase [Gryllotalpicola protaetiae]
MTEHIVVVGALNADLAIRVDRLPAPGETVSGRDVEVLPGGKAANQAVAAARLGGRVRLVGAVGDDDSGRMLREHAAAAGVDTSFVAMLPEVPTGQAIIPVDDAGENSIILVPGANGAIGPENIPVEAYADAAIVCLSLEVPLPVVLRAAARAVAAGAAVVLNPSPFRPLPGELLDAVSVLIVNELEAEQLLGPTVAPAWPGAAKALRAALQPHGIDRIVVTRGAAGAVVVDGKAVTEVHATSVDAVDTTGAGDAFTGALAVRLAEGDPLAAAAAEASVVAAFSTTRRGAQPSYPTASELAEWR